MEEKDKEFELVQNSKQIIIKNTPTSWYRMKKVRILDTSERAAYDNSGDDELDYPDW